LIRLSELLQSGLRDYRDSGFSLVVQIDGEIDPSSRAALISLLEYPGLIGGIILKENNPALINECRSSNSELVFAVLEKDSQNFNPLAEWLLHYYQGKYISLSGGAILLPSELLQGAELRHRDKQTQVNSLSGRAVKVLHYQSGFLYGKIEKPLKSQDTILVNTPDGFVETRLENIYFID
jgi:hypothetical protein